MSDQLFCSLAIDPSGRIMNLDSLAPQMMPTKAAGVYRLLMPGGAGKMRLYVDPEDKMISEALRWLEFSRGKFGGTGSDLVPLYVNGMTKVCTRMNLD